MKKKIAVSLLIFGACFSLMQGVFARTYSSIKTGPEAFSGRTTTTSITNISSSVYDYIRGDRTYFYIETFGFLREGVCVSDSSRKATIKLYEDDVYPNADDLVKTYTFSFVGRNLSGANIQVATNQATAIDSGYDNTVELYHTLYIAPIAGDSGSTNGPIYTYQYAVD